MLPRNPEQIDQIIRMAWCDRTSFETIEQKIGLSEAEVIRTMRRVLKPKSYRIWRERVSGRAQKHLKRFRSAKEDLRPFRSSP